MAQTQNAGGYWGELGEDPSGVIECTALAASSFMFNGYSEISTETFSERQVGDVIKRAENWLKAAIIESGSIQIDGRAVTLEGIAAVAILLALNYQNTGEQWRRTAAERLLVHLDKVIRNGSASASQIAAYTFASDVGTEAGIVIPREGTRLLLVAATQVNRQASDIATSTLMKSSIILLGCMSGDPTVKKQSLQLIGELPRPVRIQHVGDLFLATLAMWRAFVPYPYAPLSEEWERWRSELQSRLTELQDRQSGIQAGSWMEVTNGAEWYNRVCSTSKAVIALSFYQKSRGVQKVQVEAPKK